MEQEIREIASKYFLTRRLLNKILSILQNGNWYAVSEITQQVGYSYSTVYRYIRILIQEDMLEKNYKEVEGRRGKRKKLFVRLKR